MNKELTADEMFAKLRYEKSPFDIDKDEENYTKFSKGTDICFDLNTKEIIINEYSRGVILNTQELQAINRKCKELGWIK